MGAEVEMTGLPGVDGDDGRDELGVPEAAAVVRMTAAAAAAGGVRGGVARAKGDDEGGDCDEAVARRVRSARVMSALAWVKRLQHHRPRLLRRRQREKRQKEVLRVGREQSDGQSEPHIYISMQTNTYLSEHS